MQKKIVTSFKSVPKLNIVAESGDKACNPFVENISVYYFITQ